MTCDCQWSLGLPHAAAGSKKVSLPTGEQERIPLRFELPAALPAGPYELTASVHFSNGETQKDAFTIDVLPRPADLSIRAKIALLDPKGETGKLLSALKVPFDKVEANADLSSYDILIVGKEALTPDGPGPDVGRVRDGLKVILFEQSAKVLEQRFGFRVGGVRPAPGVSARAGYPLLAGLDANLLRDWRGEATILPPQLQYTLRPRYGPTCSGAASTCRGRGAAAAAATWLPC